MRSWARGWVVAGMVLACAGPVFAGGGGTVLTLATTTSTENSGLLAYLHPHFEEATGIRVMVIGKGTGASLQIARDGNADVVLVHAPALEEQFVAEGYGIMRRQVMYNDFVIIGPAGDPAGIRGAGDPGEALRAIARGGFAFVSRGDASGTHVKEQELWRSSGVALESDTVSIGSEGESRSVASVRPPGDWYVSIGRGMGPTILATTEREAYTLADRGTYYAFALAEPPRTDLVILNEGHESLANQYSVIVVNPARNPGVNVEAARRYVEWITSPETQALIGAFRVQGRVLFHPNAAAREAG